jgi:hypothetical protein
MAAASETFSHFGTSMKDLVAAQPSISPGKTSAKKIHVLFNNL